MKMPTVPEIRKGLTALAGFIAVVISLGVLHGTAQEWLVGALSFLTFIGVYQIKNADPPQKILPPAKKGMT